MPTRCCLWWCYWVFLLIFCYSISCWYEINNYNCGFVYFYLQFYQSWLYIMYPCCLVHVHLEFQSSWWIDTFYHIISFVSYNSFWPKSLFYLMWVWSSLFSLVNTCMEYIFPSVCLSLLWAAYFLIFFRKKSIQLCYVFWLEINHLPLK